MANMQNNLGIIRIRIGDWQEYVPITSSNNVYISTDPIVSEDYILSYSEIEKEPFSDN